MRELYIDQKSGALKWREKTANPVHNAELLVALADSIESLMAIVEGVRSERWESSGRRLVDTPEWVAFYTAHQRCKNAPSNK